ERRMREICTSGATSGDWKRSSDGWTEAPATAGQPLLPTVSATAPVVDSTCAVKGAVSQSEIVPPGKGPLGRRTLGFAEALALLLRHADRHDKVHPDPKDDPEDHCKR